MTRCLRRRRRAAALAILVVASYGGLGSTALRPRQAACGAPTAFQAFLGVPLRRTWPRAGTSPAEKMTMIARPSEVFVAGASGQLGRRIVRELLAEGLRVTAAVPPLSLEGAENMLRDGNFIAPDLVRNLKVLAVDPGSVGDCCRAMQGSQSVVCAQGALEDPDGFSPPASPSSEVDGGLSQSVVQAARETGSVRHCVLITARETPGKFGIPAGVVKLFSKNLEEQRKAEQALRDSDLAYTILRPGTMEGPGDDFELTHNVRVLPKGAPAGGMVSRLQVAKVAAAAVVAPSGSTNKVMDLVAEDLAPKVSYSDLVLDAKIEGSEELWKNSLNPAQYYVLRMGGTEPAYSSPMNGEKREGDFVCAGCGQPLFRSDSKFNSGTGWPSFFQPLEEKSVRIVREGGLFPRREVRCSNCDGHLGHVFPDGPKPTGLRYCMNGVALKFKPAQRDKGP